MTRTSYGVCLGGCLTQKLPWLVARDIEGQIAPIGRAMLCRIRSECGNAIPWFFDLVISKYWDLNGSHFVALCDGFAASFC